MSAQSNSIVAAYLDAHATDKAIDASELDLHSIEARKAVFAKGGADYYALAWTIDDSVHAALTALLAASRVQLLIENYGLQNDRDQHVVTFGVEELNEVRQIRQAMVNIWCHLDGGRDSVLRPLAIDLGLIDQRGLAVD